MTDYKLSDNVIADADRATQPVAWPTILLFAVFCSVAALVSYAALIERLPLWVAFCVNAATFYGLAHVNHEAFHRNICYSGPLQWRLNDAFGRFVSFIFFFSFPAFRAVHLAHHAHTNDPEKDADMWVARKNPIAVALTCATLLARYEVQMWRLAKRNLLSRTTLVVFYLERLVAAGFVALAFASGFGVEILILWVGPALANLPVIAFFFAYTVHHPHTERGEAVAASNIILTHPLLQPAFTALYAFQNYHLVHHMNPRIPFYNYGKAFRQLRSELSEKGAIIKQVG